MPRPFLTAEWKNLLMANYPVDPAVLRPYLPTGTELDTFDSQHYVSLVGFLFANTKVLGLSIPYHRTFEEVNLRFYVRYRSNNVWKRGVVFIKEIVPRTMISLIANTLYGEAYTTHQMNHAFTTNEGEMLLNYQWKVGTEWNYIKATTLLHGCPVVAGSAEEFITEHYWGYTFINAGCSGTYQVVHPQWNVHPVTHYEVHCNAQTLYGPGFADVLSAKPASVFMAAGSEVAVMKGSRIRLNHHS